MNVDLRAPESKVVQEPSTTLTILINQNTDEFFWNLLANKLVQAIAEGKVCTIFEENRLIVATFRSLIHTGYFGRNPPYLRIK